jgi:hypothetical protein
MSAEGEEYPLLEAVTRKRLVETVKDRELQSVCSSDFVKSGNCDNVAVICSYDMKVVNKSDTQSKTPSIVTHSRENIDVLLR